MVQWHEGEWTLQVNNSTVADDTDLAKTLVAYLQAHFLPETHGLLVVANAGDGEHSSLAWTDGPVVYWCGD